MAGCCSCGAGRLTKMGGQIGPVVHGSANHGYLSTAADKKPGWDCAG